MPPTLRFADHWRHRKAECLLFGEGPGPEGEMVRVVGRAARGRFTVFYIRCYEQGAGHGEAVYRWLKQQYSQLHAMEIVSTGFGFQRRMAEKGVLDLGLCEADCEVGVLRPGRENRTNQEGDPGALAPSPSQ
jgi:hypothetical protein